MSHPGYRITLYHKRFFCELITYEFPILPVIGDLIEVVEETTMFVVQERAFKPRYGNGHVYVTLFGSFENDEKMEQHTFEKVRDKILNQQAS